MTLTNRFLLLATAALLTNPAAAQSNVITVSWVPVAPSAVPTLSTYATIALTLLLAIVAFRVIKARPVAARHLVVAALSVTALAAAVLVPQVIASDPVTIPIDSGCGPGSATYPADDRSVSFFNQCDVAMQIQLNFDQASCTESESKAANAECSNCVYSGDLIEPTTGDVSPYRLAYCPDIPA